MEASDKGKGRAIPNDNDNSSDTSHPSQAPSLLSRIAASAEGLTRSALGAPNTTEAISALSNTDKGQNAPGSSHSTAYGESSNPTLKSGIHQPVAGGSTGFRESHNEEHVRQSEAEFGDFLDGIEAFRPSDDAETSRDVSLTSGKSITTGVDPFDEAWSRSQLQPATTTSYRTIAEQQSRDGEDVLALLTSPTLEQFEAPHEDDENYDWRLSPEQVAQLREITKELFPPMVQHGMVSTDNSLNLIPIHEKAHSMDVAATQEWRAQWEEVLNSYTDEVWGGLLPLVREARQEAEDMKGEVIQADQRQPKALRRLEAILGHLQGR